MLMNRFIAFRREIVRVYMTNSAGIRSRTSDLVYRVANRYTTCPHKNNADSFITDEIFHCRFESSAERSRFSHCVKMQYYYKKKKKRTNPNATSSRRSRHIKKCWRHCKRKGKKWETTLNIVWNPEMSTTINCSCKSPWF